ncbi:amidohydrolase [Raineyella antarctica]|uniref:Amidohydrolase n=1 Tax=Raineyella antarctica TaxID=1577474 RepID=A0A1G6H541_9ACTN|nr:amidohydrolase [Raineyella antarctica]SDB89228.1 amidohydrolase [Raineyella antarctica]
MTAAPTTHEGDPGPAIAAASAALSERMIAFRRDLHSHPELGHAERRTTQRVADSLAALGLEPQVLPVGTGLTCDIIGDGWDPSRGMVALRGDMDALPLTDAKDVSYASKYAGVTHACGHDVHTTVVLGVGHVLVDLRNRGLLKTAVRLVFQPAEESTPSGAPDVIRAGALEGVREAYALHCDPRTTVGQIAVKRGAITSAAVKVNVNLRGTGGHTSRPHLTADIIGALGSIVTQTPFLLSRRIDPRSGASLIWGRIAAGSVENAIPRTGEVGGTLRVLDVPGWKKAVAVLPDLISSIVAPFGAELDIDIDPGIPPTVNDPRGVARLVDAAERQLGADSVARTAQSLGGEDFAWILQAVPGAMARLGVRPRGVAEADWPDIHQPGFDVDEECIQVGVRVLSRLAATPIHYHDPLPAPRTPAERGVADHAAAPSGGKR